LSCKLPALLPPIPSLAAAADCVFVCHGGCSATNVAETSLTIPGIKYVIDSGREKRKVYDPVTGHSKFTVGWISRASAAQRAGRAGRTGPGHVYRLYSSAVFGHAFLEYSPPEISTTPVDAVLLSMMAMNVRRVASFPFPTPPDEVSLRLALRTLTVLGAVEPAAAAATTKQSKQSQQQQTGDDLVITPLGRTLAAFPIAPRYAKMLTLANRGTDGPSRIFLATRVPCSD
jgi:ATP-dependent RNA helicase DHX37/DHR1